MIKKFKFPPRCFKPAAALTALALVFALPVQADNDVSKQAKAAYQRGDYAEAKRLIEPEALKGDAKAQTRLGVLYEKGRGVAQNYALARQWFEKAAAQYNASAQYNLGILYEDGRGVAKNYALARQWFEKASAQGHENAKRALKQLKAMGY